MSWFRSAVIRAVEAGGNSKITNRVKSYAGSVVHQAVTGGARIFQDRTGNRMSASFKQTMKNLEDSAVSCRGIERVQLLHRWLYALQDTRREFGDKTMDYKSQEQTLSSIEGKISLSNNSSIPYLDSEVGEEHMYFRDVFLYSQALEGITASMIMEAPNDDEVYLLLQIFGHCLTGGKEVHSALVRSIQNMSKAFSDYEDEVLVKRNELLEFARGSISGLKLNADIERLEYEVSRLQQKVDKMEELQVSNKDHALVENTTLALVESLKEALEEVRVCSRLEALLLQKKNTRTGEALDSYFQKVDKLKVLAESLTNSSSRAEKRIIDHRIQKEDALNFRIAKANEAKDAEKDLLCDIARLEEKRNALHAELNQVDASLATSFARLKKSREEKIQFDDASDQVIMQLKAKEDELKNSAASCQVEADVVQVWIKFLEDTWKLQSSYREQMDKQTSDELEKYGNCFARSIKHHLSACKDGLNPSIDHIGTLADNMKKYSRRPEPKKRSTNQIHEGSDPKTFLEEEYLATEKKILSAFSMVDHMEELFYHVRERGSRSDDVQVSELFRSIEQMRLEFESFDRPTLDIEMKVLEEEKSEISEVSKKSEISEKSQILEQLEKSLRSPLARERSIGAPRKLKSFGSRSIYDDDEHSDAESEITQLELEYSKASSQFYPCDDLVDWDFD